MPEFKELQLPNGKLWLNIARGTVAGQQKWSETSVHSSGGGGHVGQQGGYVSPPSVWSTSREKHEFWIQEGEGKEVAISLTDGHFPVREGQQVWVAWGGNVRNKSNGSYLFAFNHASGVSRDLMGEWKAWLYKRRLLKTPLLYRLLTTWLPLILGLLIGFVWLPVFMTPNIMPGALPQNATAAQILKLVSNPHHIAQHWPNAIAATLRVKFGSMLFAAGATWIGSLLFMKLFGKLLFRSWWERKQVAAIREKILHSCQSEI